MYTYQPTTTTTHTEPEFILQDVLNTTMTIFIHNNIG